MTPKPGDREDRYEILETKIESETEHLRPAKTDSKTKIRPMVWGTAETEILASIEVDSEFLAPRRSPDIWGPIYKTSYEKRKAFLMYDSLAKSLQFEIVSVN